jgi:hypothetical protein
VIPAEGAIAPIEAKMPKHIGFPSILEACKISFNFYLKNIEYLKIMTMIPSVSPPRKHADFTPYPTDSQRDAVGLGVLHPHGDECGRRSNDWQSDRPDCTRI